MQACCHVNVNHGRSRKPWLRDEELMCAGILKTNITRKRLVAHLLDLASTRSMDVWHPAVGSSPQDPCRKTEARLMQDCPHTRLCC